MNAQTARERYSLLIQWSEKDGAYIVTFPEFPIAHTHGATRQEALKNAEEVLEMLVEGEQEDGQPLPSPALYSSDMTDALLAELEQAG